MLIDLIAGARPNFIKIAPIIDALEEFAEGRLFYRLIHTGQHYDKNMSGSFFVQLKIPEPHHNLEAGGGTQAEQAANIMVRYEKLLIEKKCDLTLVVGDVTSTMACAIAAKKMNIRVAHVEAGIRSGDLSMPEEINRMVTDSITDYFFTTSKTANDKLSKLGVSDSVFFVGNTMIDTLLKNESRFMRPACWRALELEKRNYFIVTLHRPANVDEEGVLKEMLEEITSGSQGLPVVFPVHPRTATILSDLGVQFNNLHIIEPLGYLEFNYLVKYAKGVITDSGGITEETTVMGVPCLTLRDNTERPETVTVGTNELVGTNPEAIKPALEKLFGGGWKEGGVPEKWDGNAAKRIVDILLDLSSGKYGKV